MLAPWSQTSSLPRLWAGNRFYGSQITQFKVWILLQQPTSTKTNHQQNLSPPKHREDRVSLERGLNGFSVRYWTHRVVKVEQWATDTLGPKLHPRSRIPFLISWNCPNTFMNPYRLYHVELEAYYCHSQSICWMTSFVDGGNSFKEWDL